MERVRLGDVCDVFAGQGAPQGANNYCDCTGGIPFIKAGDLSDLLSGKSEYEIQCVTDIVAQKHKLKLYPAGSILFAKSGMSCMKGYIYRVQKPSYVVSHLAVVVPQKVDGEYLKYYLEFYKPNSLIKDSAYPSISLQDISNMELNLPCMEKQKEFANNLQKINELIFYRKQQLSKLDELVKSRFIEMFGDVAQNPNGYPIKDFDEISVLITDGEHATPRRTEKGIYLLSARNILNHAIQLDDVDHIDEDEYVHIARRVVPQAGDVLISCSGSIGRCCVVPNGLKFQMVRSAALIRFNNTINPYFAEWLITSDELQRQIAQSATQSSQANLFQGKIRKLHGYVPPMELQNQFAAFVQQTDKLKLSVKQSLKKLETLKKALMQNYFG